MSPIGLGLIWIIKIVPHQIQSNKLRTFTRLDMKDGYHHLRIREGDEKHTAFITEYGLFEWTVACFGLRNAPAEFVRFMSNILIDYINDFVVVYLHCDILKGREGT